MCMMLFWIGFDMMTTPSWVMTLGLPSRSCSGIHAATCMECLLIIVVAVSAWLLHLGQHIGGGRIWVDMIIWMVRMLSIGQGGAYKLGRCMYQF
mmetsp:Transcript_3280/g.7192  ORF Transcript_3280/g.7192 Transcript_3280/m.7192 type:complete len:94 (-) Transcript_3280:664-945(-)